MERPPIELASTVLGTPDAQALADLYQRLLGWDPVGHVFCLFPHPELA